MPKNYGLILDPIIVDKDYLAGGYGDLGGEGIQPDGQWDNYLPLGEQQRLGVETQACVSFGTLNCLEILANRQFGFTENWSDRFLAYNSKTTKQGNSPQNVAEALRKDGVPKEDEWPNSLSLDTWEEFYEPIKASIFKLAENFTQQFDFKHQYVPGSPAVMKSELTKSPLGISVPAWFKRDGLYYRPEGMGDNHWVVCYGYVDGKYWKIFDSYTQDGEYIKKLEWNCLPMQAKRYQLPLKDKDAQVMWIIGFLLNLPNYFKNWWDKIYGVFN